MTSESSAAFFDGSFQALAVESMARRTSTRPTVLEEEDVKPWNLRTASATGAAVTVAGRVPRSFGHAPGPFEGGPKVFLVSGVAMRLLAGRTGQ